MVEKVPNATMEDYLNGKLQLDHIMPLSSYNFESADDEEFKEAWSLKNLQLLLASDNRSKNDKLDGTHNNESFNLNYISYEILQENLKNNYQNGRNLEDRLMVI